MSGQIPQRSAPAKPRRGALSGLLGLIGFSALAGILVTVSVTPAVALTGITASSTIGIFDSLPEYIDIGQQPERNEIYAHNRDADPTVVDGWQRVATIYDQDRQEIPIDQMSQFVLDATVDGEDRRFFEHGGVDVASVVRAAVGNVVAGDITSGSSTLTMQLVKNINVQQALEEATEADREAAYAEATDPSFERKLKEMKLAIGLEKRYTKNEILAAYLNTVFYADNTYGIEAAAQRYYSVSAKDLTLAQAASLVAIVQYPNLRGLDNPENYAANQDRRDYILGQMLDAGDVTQAQYDEAVAIDVSDETLKPSVVANGCRAANDFAKWFCDYVRLNVSNFPQLGQTPEERVANWALGGWKLYTTLDINLQLTAQQAIWQNVPYDGSTGISLGSSAVSVQPGTGRVLTMAENMIFDDAQDSPGGTSSVNYATSLSYGGSTGFQAGSTYKLFTLLAWLSAGHGLGERVLASARKIEQSKFHDRCNGPWGGIFDVGNDSGESGVRDIMAATAGSVNGAFVSMAMQLDLCDIRDMAVALGVVRGNEDPLETMPATVLGTNEITPLGMAGAYAAVAAQGLYCKPIVLDKVIAPDGTELPGQTPDCKQAVPQNIANTAAYALQGVMSGGTGSASNPGDGIPILGKTGTTDSGTDTWVITSTTAVTTAVWVGNSIGKISMSNWTAASGTSGRLVRHDIMSQIAGRANQLYGGNAFPGPDDSLLSGGGGIPVPDVIGQTPEQAQSTILALGFEFANGGQVDSGVPVGRVAATDPGAGGDGVRGQVVTVYISRGNQNQVPDAVSGSDTYNEAKSVLQSAGFNNVHEGCAVVTNPSDVGKPISQNPAAGTSAAPNTSITVSTGKLVCP
jgi:membrane peptidoglycan carboxypeptidase